MARLAYECNLDLRLSNSSEEPGIKPFACTADKYCLYCCCNPQCCLLVQRKPPKHFWEAWYFWLSIALLLLFLVSSISSYVVSNCRHSFQAIAFGQNVQTSNRRNGRTENGNEISINVIPTSGMLPSHRKMLLCAPQPSITHMRRKCICTSKACKEAGVEVCRTRFSCYTEEIYDIDGSSRDNTSTRGCTEGATPLLCETNAWTRTSRGGSKSRNPVGTKNELKVDSAGGTTTRRELVWPRLKCCDTHDYCNSIVSDHATNNNRRVEQSLSKSSKNIVVDENSRSRLVSMSESRSDYRGVPIESSGSSLHDRETGTTTIVTDFEDRERSYDPLGHRMRPLHVAAVVLAIAALTSVLGACYVITRFNHDSHKRASPMLRSQREKSREPGYRNEYIES